MKVSVTGWRPRQPAAARTNRFPCWSGDQQGQRFFCHEHHPLYIKPLFARFFLHMWWQHTPHKVVKELTANVGFIGNKFPYSLFTGFGQIQFIPQHLGGFAVGEFNFGLHRVHATKIGLYLDSAKTKKTDDRAAETRQSCSVFFPTPRCRVRHRPNGFENRTDGRLPCLRCKDTMST